MKDLSDKQDWCDLPEDEVKRLVNQLLSDKELVKSTKNVGKLGVATAIRNAISTIDSIVSDMLNTLSQKL